MADSFHRWVVFYDGECGMCARTVQWLLARDRKGKFHYAPLQGETAHALPAHLRQLDALDTLVVAHLAEDGSVHQLATHSTAVITIGSELGGRWRRLARIAALLPRSLRDFIYRQIAKRRHRFKPPETCRLLSSRRAKSLFALVLVLAKSSRAK